MSTDRDAAAPNAEAPRRAKPGAWQRRLGMVGVGAAFVLLLAGAAAGASVKTFALLAGGVAALGIVVILWGCVEGAARQ